MSIESPTSLPLEIGHVLFIDIVGYSKLLINEQSEAAQKLNELVRRTPQARAAEAEHKLLRLPSGDGMALVFRDKPEAPAKAALEICQALKEHPEIQVRMGINSGPINEIADVNERANIAGGGINIAQRVMDCGDAGHILVSKRVADDLAQYREWQPRLHDLGECEVKHGVRLGLANLYTDELGNRNIPTKLQKSARPRPARFFYYSLGAALALLLSLLGLFALSRKNAQPLPPAMAGEKRIAVLPFRPLVPAERDEVLELGMADTLIAKLSNSREIIVASLSSVRRYENLETDPAVAGRELGVSSVLEGNVQRSGDKIRVTARLINVADGRSLWSDTFDEKFTDVFTVQNAISQKVADALALRLSGEERARLTRRETENLQAYQLYLTGRYHYARLIPPEIRTAIGFFQQAIDLDPHYARAYFGLAEAYRSLTITSDVPSKDSLPQAKAAAEKALEIDEGFAEAHASLSFSIIWYDWGWATGEREAKRAIALNNNSAFAHFAYAHVLSDLGRHEEAIAESNRACEIEPVYLLFRALHGMFLHHAGRDDEAYVSLQKTLALDPTFWITHLTLGKVFIQQHKYSEAIREFEQAKDLSHGNSEATASIGYVAALAGDTTRARAILDELRQALTERYVPPVAIALVYNGLGEEDNALSWLERGCEERDVRLTLLKVDPKWNSYRANPRFVAILKRIGLD